MAFKRSAVRSRLSPPNRENPNLKKSSEIERFQNFFFVLTLLMFGFCHFGFCRSEQLKTPELFLQESYKKALFPHNAATQAPSRHIRWSAYGCCIPTLTRFTGPIARDPDNSIIWRNCGNRPRKRIYINN